MRRPSKSIGGIAMNIPFTKAHGAGNDFLLTWREQAPANDLPAVARAICNRNTGIGADGWLIVDGTAIRLFNADGSEAEISGNGTRCAAALLVRDGKAGQQFDITTGAGAKHLRLVERDGNRFVFEMNMGVPRWLDDQVRYHLPLTSGSREVTILDVGNPQCAVMVDEIPSNWREVGAEIEGHSFFPERTNVSFVRVVDQGSIEARFFERGAGATLSSGTGSTGAAVAAILRKAVRSPVRVITEAGDLNLRWDDSVYLTGPAVISGAGECYLD
jgi:diaminopimelate epimerase